MTAEYEVVIDGKPVFVRVPAAYRVTYRDTDRRGETHARKVLLYHGNADTTLCGKPTGGFTTKPELHSRPVVECMTCRGLLGID